MPLVSVIIPIYNTEKFLPLCISSVLNQTLTDIEVLLVNDGSTDGSGKICDEYACKDQRIQVIHTLNQGVSHARNQGLETAKGEYIAFMDSDDWIETDMIATLYQLSGQTKPVWLLADISLKMKMVVRFTTSTK